MTFTQWLRKVFGPRMQGSRACRRGKPRQYQYRYRPSVERLEDRLAPASFLVTNTADSGAGSLRQAILDAKPNGVADIITFDPSLAKQTISLTTNDASAPANLGPTGLMIQNDNITIDGSGASQLQISGNNERRVFLVTSGATLKLQFITITGGRSQGVDGNPGGSGGGGGGGGGRGGGGWKGGGLRGWGGGRARRAALRGVPASR